LIKIRLLGVIFENENSKNYKINIKKGFQNIETTFIYVVLDIRK
jgi:hypothetical protein